MKENQEKQKAETKETESFTLKAGTVLRLGDHSITLTEDSTLHFDGAHNEELLVGMLATSRNLDANREQLKGTYNGFGMLIPDENPQPQPEPTAAEEKQTEEEFQRTVENHQELAGGLPVAPLDPHVVPSQQRAPALGSPELKDVEKMNNMDQVPGFKGFAPLASQPDASAPEQSAQPQVNEDAGNTVENHATTDRGAQNAPPNTAIEAAKAEARTLGDIPKSSIADDAAAAKKTETATGEQSAAKTPTKPAAKKPAAKKPAAKKAAPKRAKKSAK